MLPSRSLRTTVLPTALVLLALAPHGAVDAQGHVHGEATLDIGIEGRTGIVEFRSPADNIYGFERAPRNDAERARRDAALMQLRTQPLSMVRFDRAFNCALVPSAVAVHDEADGHGEVRARYLLSCQRPPAGGAISFAFSERFPGVESVKVQLVSDTAQVGLTVVRDRGEVVP